CTQPLGRAAKRVHSRGIERIHAHRERHHGRPVQAVLAAEIVVDRGDVRARGLYDAADARIGEAVARELLDGGCQYAQPRLVTLWLTLAGEHALPPSVPRDGPV